MKPIDCKMRTHFINQDSKNVRNATKRMKKILDANHEKDNLKKILNNFKYLNNDIQSIILKLLRKHEEMLDGILGNYTGSEYKNELLQRAKPYHVKPFPISKIDEETLQTEVNRLINIDVLNCKSSSKWEAPTIVIPKKNGTICFISDFRELNKKIKRKTFPILKKQDLLLK